MNDRDWDDYIKRIGWWGWWRDQMEGRQLPGGGNGDGWTAIAALLLFGLAAAAVFYIAWGIFTVYRFGISPYFYVVEAREGTAALIGCLIVGVGLQIGAFLAIFRHRRLIDILAYLVILPPLNMLAVGLGYLTEATFEKWFASISAGLPRAGQLTTDVAARDVASNSRSHANLLISR